MKTLSIYSFDIDLNKNLCYQDAIESLLTGEASYIGCNSGIDGDGRFIEANKTSGELTLAKFGEFSEAEYQSKNWFIG